MEVSGANKGQELDRSGERLDPERLDQFVEVAGPVLTATAVEDAWKKRPQIPKIFQLASVEGMGN